jgi:hypothetical protein
MLKHATFLHTVEMESLASLCFRALDGSNYEVRCAVARLLGALMAATQTPRQAQPHAQGKPVGKPVSLEEALGVLMGGFLRGGVGFLKGTGEMIKGMATDREDGFVWFDFPDLRTRKQYSSCVAIWIMI